MKELKLTLDKYMQHIKEAHQRGEIHFGRPEYKFLGPRDRDYRINTPQQENHFSHLPKYGEPGYLGGCNTRVLSSIAGLVYRFLLRNIPQEKKLSVLSLGAGLGTEPSDISYIAEEYHRPVEIHTVALTPLDPTLRVMVPRQARETQKEREILLKRGAPVNEAFIRYLCDQSRKIAPELNHKIEKAQKGNPLTYPDKLPIELVFEMHNHGVKIFDATGKPYITHQFIGDLAKPEDIGQFRGPYDFQHDDRGAFEYTHNWNDSRILEMIISSLSQDGVFFAKKMKLVTVKKGADGASFNGADLKLPEGVLLLTGKDTDYKEELEGLIFREGSIPAKALEDVVRDHPREGRVIKVESLCGLLYKHLSAS